MTHNLNLIFRRVGRRVTKILNLWLENQGVVGRVAHAKSSDPANPPKKKFETCTKRQNKIDLCDIHLGQKLHGVMTTLKGTR